jgi:hypothetical protein
MLSEWLANRWLQPHETSPLEISDLLDVVDRDLADASVVGLSADWRLSIAHNAILQLATCALAAEGYRPDRQRAHERAILSLQWTIGLEQETVTVLDAVRRKRNISNYERAGRATGTEAAEVLGIARELRTRVRSWLRAKHPHLFRGRES